MRQADEGGDDACVVAVADHVPYESLVAIKSTPGAIDYVFRAPGGVKIIVKYEERLSLTNCLGLCKNQPDHGNQVRARNSMNIYFPHDKPGIYTLNNTVAFPAVVNDRNLVCEITEEALKECFALSPSQALTKSEYDAAVVAAFEQHRARIEQAASRRLSSAAEGTACLLTQKDFF